jgi:hypothetical protein
MDPVVPGTFWPGRIRAFFDIKICKVEAKYHSRELVKVGGEKVKA